MTERNSILVKMDEDGFLETVKFQNGPEHIEDETLVFTSDKENPIGAFVRRNNKEYILLVPCSDNGLPPRKPVIDAIVHFCFVCDVKAIWVIGTDLEITDGIRGRVPDLLSEEGFLPSINNSDGRFDSTMQEIKDDAGTDNIWVVFVNYDGIVFRLEGKNKATSQDATVKKDM